MTSLARVKRATKRRDKANAEWHAAIIAAHTEGHSLRAIAKVAGVTNPRIHQIVSSLNR